MTAHDAPLPTLIDGARAAMSRADWPAAFGHWEHIRLRHPDHAEAQLNAALALLQLGHVAQADALLLRGATAFPDHFQLALESARNAFRSGDWAAAQERWRAVMDRFPDSPDAFAGVGASLQLLGRLDDAEPVLAEAVGRFPDHIDIAIEWARVPHRRADWPTALARWSDVVRRFPDHPEGYAGVGVALQLLGRLDEADALLRGAADRFPTHSGIAIEYARIPHRRADWQAALQRWQAVIERCPDAPDGPIGAGIALRQ
ncbi:MAG TPA: tetratricopeptide repeat protein, partial [Stellaceae bacterium]|nr:tetratricopeptide repeat protein [Stellaceae bacterium]